MNTIVTLSSSDEISQNQKLDYLHWTYVRGKEIEAYSYTTNSIDLANSSLNPFYSLRKESFYKRLVDNLFKKNNFLSLNLELETGQITEDDFEKELQTNEQKYLIEISDKKPSFDDLLLISQIINDTNKDLSIDDVSELFSTDLSDVEESIVCKTEFHFQAQ